jgi:epoxyqueuosine reductase
MLIAELVRFLGINNCRARVVSTSHIAEIESTISHLGQSQSIDAAFYTELTGYYDFDCNAALPYARSIIITASFQPPARAFFDGKAVVIPPTYIYADIRQRQLELVTSFLEPLGYRIASARLPLKTLAVRSGLGKYGHNNICYIPGMGSFSRLGAF